jgi:hypothetical protein
MTHSKMTLQYNGKKNTQCCFAKFYYAECRHAECRHAECRHAECRHAECHYADCRGAMPTTIAKKLRCYFLFLEFCDFILL